MSTGVKMKLTPEQETLLITLYAKAQAGNPLFFDPKAEDILNQIDYDFARLRVPYKTVVLICQRAKKLDDITRAFLDEHPGAVVLQLGCGLDSRFLRVDDGRRPLVRPGHAASDRTPPPVFYRKRALPHDRRLCDESSVDERCRCRRAAGACGGGRIVDVSGRGRCAATRAAAAGDLPGLQADR